MNGWWAGRIRQFRRHLTGRVSAAEREALRTWLTERQQALFDAMPRADQRHGLDVVATLRASGHRDPDLLLAGLLHDCGKGRAVRLWHRVAWSLAERYGARMLAWASPLPGSRDAFDRIAHHAERSALMALEAGCSPRTAALIRDQAAPTEPHVGEALRVADERN